MKKQQINTEKLSNSLSRIAQNEISNNVNYWPNLRDKLERADKIRDYRFSYSHMKWATIASFSLVLGLGIVLAYVLNPILQDLIEEDAGLSYVQDRGLGLEYDLSQTVDDVIVNLEWGYIDANRVSLGLTMTATDSTNLTSMNFMPISMTLLTADDVELAPMMGQGNNIEGMGGIILTFETPDSIDLSEPLNLHFELFVDAYSEAIVTDIIEEDNQMREVDLIGAFIFDFILQPVNGFVIDLQQESVAQDIALELKTITVAPSAVMITVCHNTISESVSDWLPIMELITEVGLADILFEGQVSIDTDGNETCYQQAFFVDPSGYAGNWILTVTELTGFQDVSLQSMGQVGDTQVQIIGPWIFEFSAPQLD